MEQEKIDNKIKVSSAAREAMGKERARIMGRKKRRISIFERAADIWKQRKEREETEVEENRADEKKDIFSKDTLKEIIEEKRLERAGVIKTTDEMGWKQYNPWKKQAEEAKENKRVNSASIWVFARRLMAREWARALGKKLPDPKASEMEREAAEFGRRKEEEERRILAEKEAGERAIQEEILAKKRLREEKKQEQERKIKGCNWVAKSNWDEKTEDWVKKRQEQKFAKQI